MEKPGGVWWGERTGIMEMCIHLKFALLDLIIT